MQTNTNKVAAVTIYVVVDTQTGKATGKYKTRAGALREAARKDMRLDSKCVLIGLRVS